MIIHWMIVCRSGVFRQGMSDDFLSSILVARDEKSRAAVDLPRSTFRVQLRYPNGERVPSADIKAAFRALSDEKVLSSVRSRLAAAAALRRGAVVADRRFFSSTADGGFCQAGVVAPPDSLTGETLHVSGGSYGV